MKKNLLASAVIMALGAGAGMTDARLENGAVLSFGAGSKFKLGFDVPISSNDGIIIGVAQPASGSHLGLVDGTENPGLDNPWVFFGNTGMHQTTSPVVQIDDLPGRTHTLDFSGWNIAWAGSSSVPMGDPANFPSDTQQATIICSTPACADGSTYTLTYESHIKLADPSSFSGAQQTVILTGTISNPTVPRPKDEVVADFGSAGLWVWQNNSVWQLAAGANAESALVADSDGLLPNELIADFGASGLWARSGTNWTRLNGNDPGANTVVANKLAGGVTNDLTANLGAGGLWTLVDGASFVQQNSNNADYVLSGDLNGGGVNDLIADFGPGLGLWAKYDNGASWVRLAVPDSDTAILASLGGDGLANDLVVDFGGQGLWVGQSTGATTGTTVNFGQINFRNAESVAVADLDGNAIDDLVVDFGAGVGLWAWMNNSNWVFLNGNDADAVTIANVNGAGSDDVIVDFGAAGLWVYDDNTAWRQLTSANADVFAVGDFNGTGQVDIVAGFGSNRVWIWQDNTAWVFIGGGIAEGLSVGDLD